MTTKTTLLSLSLFPLLALVPFGSALAQAPAPPATFQDLYSSLNTYLTGFNTTLSAEPLSQYPFSATGNLKNANGNIGPQLVNPGSMASIELQLQELKAIGVKSVMVEVGFPMLYEPFLTGQGQTYSQYVTFYQQVAAAVRAAGLKLIVENDTLLTNDDQAGWNAGPFYATLTWTEYQQARAQTAVIVAQTMQPDYLVLLQEPQTEADNSGQTTANTPSGSAALLSQMLASVQQAGVAGMKLGAGTGTAQSNFLQYIQGYVALPVDFIDMHIYPVNDNNLPNALQIASTAAAAGKPISMSECWIWKVRDNELGVLTDDQIRARNPFDFWAPVDALFIQTMENLAAHTQMIFMNPFNTELFSSYLPYNSSTDSLAPSQMTSQEGAQAAANMNLAMFTSTATSYYASLVSPADVIPPTVPSGVAAASGNPNETAVNWNGSTDNIGVAGYYILRNGVVVGTTANLYFQDAGLTESTTYTYTIESFDLAGNISAPSLRVNVTTADVTPPTVPMSVTAVAASCQKVTVTWAPSTDKGTVGSYIVFWGPSPAALVQVARTLGTTTSFSSTPLSAGATYYYGVESADTSGNVSAMSVVVAATTPMPPSAPANLIATPLSASRVGFTWSVAASGGLPVQNYHIYRGTTAANLTQLAVALQTSYTDATVAAGSAYYYAVQAADSGTDLSAMSATILVTAPTAPSAPSGLVLTPVSTTKISLVWSVPATGGLPVQTYQVFRGSTASSLSQLAIVIQPSYTDASGSPATTYFYAVRATDTGGDLSPLSATVSATTLALPSMPANVAATSPSKTNVTVTWTAAPGGMPLVSFTIFRGSSPSNLASLQVAPATKISYSDATAVSGTTYYYAIQAKDTGGNLSPMSASVAVTTSH